MVQTGAAVIFKKKQQLVYLSHHFARSQGVFLTIIMVIMAINKLTEEPDQYSSVKSKRIAAKMGNVCCLRGNCAEK